MGLWESLIKFNKLILGEDGLMGKAIIIPISVDKELKEAIDLAQVSLGYANRSDLFRQALIEFLKDRMKQGVKK